MAVPRPRRRRVVAWGVVGLLVIVAAIVTAGAWTLPTEGASGRTITGADRAQPLLGNTLRIATYNIHSGRDVGGHLGLDKTRAALVGFDFVGLNEVSASPAVGGKCQVDVLGEQLQMGSLFAPTERRWFRDDFGNGLLTRVPVESWIRFGLPSFGALARRNLTLVRIQIGGHDVNVLITHLGRHEDRPLQIQAITQLFLSLQAPAVLMGDLNTQTNDPLLRPLLQSAGVEDPLALKAADSRRIDWILTRGMRTIDAGLKDSGASDHPLAWAELQPLP